MDLRKYKDNDIKAIAKAREALLESTSKKMLKSNLDYLMDYFIVHSSSTLPDKFKSDKE